MDLKLKVVVKTKSGRTREGTCAVRQYPEEGCTEAENGIAHLVVDDERVCTAIGKLFLSEQGIVEVVLRYDDKSEMVLTLENQS